MPNHFTTTPRTRFASWPSRATAIPSWIALTLAAALGLAIGCEKPRPPAAPPTPKLDTPEAKLERVIQRLEFALDSAQGSPEFGVKSTRNAQHRLIPPSEDEPRYTAEVIIATRRLVTVNGAPKAPADAPQDSKAQADKPQSASNVESEKFLLVYDNDRWTLPDEPKSDTLKTCFDSALSE